jgi:hypothetical protein
MKQKTETQREAKEDSRAYNLLEAGVSFIPNALDSKKGWTKEDELFLRERGNLNAANLSSAIRVAEELGALTLLDHSDEYDTVSEMAIDHPELVEPVSKYLREHNGMYFNDVELSRLPENIRVFRYDVEDDTIYNSLDHDIPWAISKVNADSEN